MYYMTVVCCKGKRVKDPETGHILEEGKPYKVKKAQYWLRRLETGDCKKYDYAKEKEKAKAQGKELDDDGQEKKPESKAEEKKPEPKKESKKEASKKNKRGGKK